jgi:hypothetical protein
MTSFLTSKMGQIAMLVSHFGNGFLDGINLVVLSGLLKFDGVRGQIWSCLIYNSLFVTSTLFFNYLGDWMSNQLSADNSFPAFDFILVALLYLIRHILFIWPLNLIVIVWNTTCCYQAVASDVFEQKQEKAQNQDRKQKQTKFSLSEFFSHYIPELIYGMLVLTVLFNLLIWVVKIFPFIGWECHFFLRRLIDAFWYFDYKWARAGWNLNKRMRACEVNWSYFFGFGSANFVTSFLLTSALAKFLPTVMASQISTLLFPFYILLAVDKDINALSADTDPGYFGFPIFFLPRTLGELLLAKDYLLFTVRNPAIKFFVRADKRNLLKSFFRLLLRAVCIAVVWDVFGALVWHLIKLEFGFIS